MGVVDESVQEWSTSVVRLFPDHAGSVLRFVGSVAHEDTALDERLVDDLRAWDAAYEAGPTRSFAWRSAGFATEHDRVGARPARRLADQIGDELEVEHHCGEARGHEDGLPARAHAPAAHGPTAGPRHGYARVEAAVDHPAGGDRGRRLRRSASSRAAADGRCRGGDRGGHACQGSRTDRVQAQQLLVNPRRQCLAVACVGV